MSATTVLIEIRRDRMLVLDGETGLEIILERSVQGRLSESCCERVVLELRAFLQPKSWQPKRRAVCALGARGVSLRRLTLPVAPKEQVPRLLRLQIESEFPLPPEALAWSYLPIGEPSGASPSQDYLVAAVRSAVIEDYIGILTRSGLNPVFTLSALARSYAFPPATTSDGSLLDLDRQEGEWVSFAQGVPAAILVLSWGLETLEQGNVSRADVDGKRVGQRVCVTGVGVGEPQVAGALARILGPDVKVEAADAASGPGRSAAVLGLKRRLDESRALPAMIFETGRPLGQGRSTGAPGWSWAAAAGILLMACVLLRLAEAQGQRAQLNAAIATVRAQREALPRVDQQLGFLQYLQTNRPPYLQVIAALAQSSTPGLRVETLSLNRRGELLLRASLPGQQTATNFRARLVESGLFTSVVVEEQTPTPDQQKVEFRIAARWDSDRVREKSDDWGEAADRPAQDLPGGEPVISPGTFTPEGMPMLPGVIPGP